MKFHFIIENIKIKIENNNNDVVPYVFELDKLEYFSELEGQDAKLMINSYREAIIDIGDHFINKMKELP